MSHFKLRNEKDCLNCGHYVPEVYCTKCGQENKEPFESVWGLTTHFVADILHWDGKFWRTLKKLIFSPGILSAEYVAGKRASYVLPIRMYLICSLIFGLSLALAFKIQAKEEITTNEAKGTPTPKGMVKFSVAKEDSVRKRYRDSMNSLNLTFPIIDQEGDMSGSLGFSSVEDKTYVELPYGITRENVDSAIGVRKKIIGEKYNYSHWIQDIILKYMAKKHGGEKRELNFETAIKTELKSSLPKSFFLLMPFFAFILWLLYNKKHYYFYHHMVFTIHYYCICFIVYSLSFLLSDTSFGDILLLLSFISMAIYLFIAMKRFYKESNFKTSLKFIIHSFTNLSAIGLTLLIIIVLGLMNA